LGTFRLYIKFEIITINHRCVPQIHWAALKAAHKEIGKTEDCLILVRLYNSARTYFMQK